MYIANVIAAIKNNITINEENAWEIFFERQRQIEFRGLNSSTNTRDIEREFVPIRRTPAINREF
jgi:hypothetical protein